jgi:hypothetical protein
MRNVKAVASVREVGLCRYGVESEQFQGVVCAMPVSCSRGKVGTRPASWQRAGLPNAAFGLRRKVETLRQFLLRLRTI